MSTLIDGKAHLAEAITNFLPLLAIYHGDHTPGRCSRPVQLANIPPHTQCASPTKIVTSQFLLEFPKRIPSVRN